MIVKKDKIGLVSLFVSNILILVITLFTSLILISSAVAYLGAPFFNNYPISPGLIVINLGILALIVVLAYKLTGIILDNKIFEIVRMLFNKKG